MSEISVINIGGTDYNLCDTTARTDLAAEAQARANADTVEAASRHNEIQAESISRQNAVNAEATARENAVNAEATARGNAINAEATARDNVIKVSSSQPSAASNKLWIVDGNANEEITVPTYDEFDDLKGAINALSHVPTLTWTLGKGLANTGAGDNPYTALTNVVVCQTGDYIINNSAVKDSNNNFLVFYVGLYKTVSSPNDTFYSRVNVGSGTKYEIPADVTGFQISGGRTSASGTQIQQADLSYFNFELYIKGASFESVESLEETVESLEETVSKALVSYPQDGTGSVTTLADATYRRIGVFFFSNAVFSTITDAPSDVNTGLTHILEVLTSKGQSSACVQILKESNEKVWERWLNINNGTVIMDWRRTDNGVGNCLFGKKLVTAGDSYTEAKFTGDYAEYNGKNYGYYIAKRNQMTFVNAGVDGSTMTAGTGSSNPFSGSRYTAIPSDTNYLVIWFGINDSGLDMPLGTISDTENTTFYGAWNKVLEYYLTNYPFMKILIIVSTGTKAVYRQAVIDVAKAWGYPYMDWVNDYSIPAFFNRTDISEDALDLRRNAFGWNGPVQYHPNPQWHEYESTIIEAKLRSI